MVVETDYWSFIQDLYAGSPGLERRSFQEQHDARMGACFGMVDSYAHHLRESGADAWGISANLEPMQRQWALERGRPQEGPRRWRLGRWKRFIPVLRRRPSPTWLLHILAEQVRAFRPDVLFSMAMETIGSDFLRSVRGAYRIAVGQHAAPLPGIDIRGYDLVLSSLPNQVDHFRRHGLRSELLRLAFDPRVLTRLTQGGAVADVAFVGGVGGHHVEGTRTLEALCTACDVAVWGYGEETLSPESPVRAAHRGPVWGLRMFQALRQSRIAFNRHIDLANGFANNVRLYEATGVGSLLLTDAKRNLAELFEPGREIVTYQSTAECVERARYYLDHPAEREAIAAAGQSRTLAEHTYSHRMPELLDILGRVL